MNCEPDCNWLEFDEGYRCNRWNLPLYGNPPQRISECEEEYIRDAIQEDRDAFREEMRMQGKRSKWR